jgi:hypothetical protein
MKTSKKVLGVVLTLIMLVNVFAVSVFAAYPDDAACALIVKTDKDTYAAGDDVTLTVAIKATADVGPMCLAGQYELGFNSAAIQPVDTSDDLAKHSFTPDAFYASAYDSSMSQAIFNDDIGSSITAGNGWDSLMLVCVADDGATAKDCADTEATLFTIKMKIPAGAADGTYTIGFNQYGYEENYSAYATSATEDLYGNDGSSYGKEYLYDFGVAEFTVGEGGGSDSDDPAQPTITVENLDTKVRWATADEEPVSKDVIYVGFEGKISGLTDVSTLAEIGFEFSTSDSALATATNVKSFVIYDFTADAANTYKFRSIVRRPLAKADIDGTTTHNIYAQAYVMVTGATTPIAATNIISTTLQAEYAQGVTNGMEDRFA